MLTLHVSVSRTRIGFDDSKDQDTLSALELHFSRVDPNREENQEYLAGNWDGLWKFVDEGEFLTGMLPLVVSYLEENKVSYKLTGEYYDWLQSDPQISIDPRLSEEISLRDYQVQSVQKALQGKRGLLDIATGGGKTEIIYSIVAHLNLPTLIVVASSRGMDEVYSRFLKYGYPEDRIGRRGDGYQDQNKEVTIAIVNSLLSGLRSGDEEIFRLILSSEVIVGDEIHHLPASGWSYVFEKSTAKWRFGFSGTPVEDYSDPTVRDLTAYGLIGTILIQIPYSYLANKGYLSKAYYIMYKSGCSSYIPEGVNGNWTALKRVAIVDNDARNLAISVVTENCYNSGGKVLVVVDQIAHGKSLLSDLSKKIDGVEFAWGGSSLSVADKGEVTDGVLSMSDLRDRYDADDSPCVLIGSPIFDEAVNLPSFNYVVIACGGKSRIKALQRVGRVLRPKAGLNYCVVIDFWDSFNFITLAHSKKRKSHYDNQGFTLIRSLQELPR